MERRKKGLKFRLFDTTQAMLLMPDGHPSRYNDWPLENMTWHNNCAYWCFPRPIDTWNDYLLAMMMMTERLRSAEKKLLYSNDRKMLVRYSLRSFLIVF